MHTLEFLHHREEPEEDAPDSHSGDTKTARLADLVRESSAEIPAVIREVAGFAIEEDSVLAKIGFKTFTPVNAFDAGGYCEMSDGAHGNPCITICISEGESRVLEPLLQIRKRSVEINAEMLGITSEQMTPELFHAFIVAHELGHAKDFLRNYQSDPEVSGWDGSDEMAMHRREILKTLPAGDVSPGDLSGVLSGTRSLDAALSLYPGIKKHPRFREIKTIENLLAIQEEEYRASEPERYADAFATQLLKKYAKELGFEELLS